MPIKPPKLHQRKAKLKLARPERKKYPGINYGSKWRRIRARHMNANPLCVECLRHGETRAAQEVDHIIPHRGDKKLFNDVTNLQSLCKSCHSKKTADGL